MTVYRDGILDHINNELEVRVMKSKRDCLGDRQELKEEVVILIRIGFVYFMCCGIKIVITSGSIGK